MFWELHIPSILDTFHKSSPFARLSSSSITRTIFNSIVHSILFRFCPPITWLCCCTSVSSQFSNSAGLPHPSFFNLLDLSIRFYAVLLLAGYSISHLAFALFMKFFFLLLSCLSISTNLRFCSSVHSRFFIVCTMCHDLLCFQHQFVSLYHQQYHAVGWVEIDSYLSLPYKVRLTHGYKQSIQCFPVLWIRFWLW